MSDVFWDAQDGQERSGEPTVKQRRPWWVTAGAIVDLLLLCAIVPLGILALIPFFFQVYVYLAQVISWVSPLLVVLNIAVLWWSFRHKRVAITALAALGLAFVAVSFVVLILSQVPIVIFGIPFGA